MQSWAYFQLRIKRLKFVFSCVWSLNTRLENENLKSSDLNLITKLQTNVLKILQRTVPRTYQAMSTSMGIAQIHFSLNAFVVHDNLL